MKDVVIKIVGTQNFGTKDQDTIELVTDGSYFYNDGKGEIHYQETELTGMEGTETSLFISPMEVILHRTGTMTSSTVFREGERNDFLYDTPYGKAVLGVDTRKIKARFNEHGGDLEIDYVMDMDHAVFGKNKFRISVREQELVQ